MRIGLAPAISIALLAASNVFAATLSQVAPVVTGAPFDVGAYVEKLGVLGFAVWMLFYFQARAKEDKQDLKNLTERAISALEKNAEGNRELAVSIQNLSNRMGAK